MRRTGSGQMALLAVLALLAASPAWADIEFYQSVDRTEVGTEDTFRLTVVVADAPPSAQVQFPAPKDFGAGHPPWAAGSVPELPDEEPTRGADGGGG